MAYSGGSALHAEESGVIGEELAAIVIKNYLQGYTDSALYHQ
jgi:hypothetical protein